MIAKYVEAGFSLIYIRTSEEERVVNLLLEDLKSSGLPSMKVLVWKPTMGLVPYGGDPRYDLIKESLEESLLYMVAPEGRDGPEPDVIYIIFGLRHFLERPAVVQGLRDAAWRLRTVGSHVIAIGPDVDLPTELADITTVVDFPLPTTEELSDLFRRITAEYAQLLSDEVGDGLIKKIAEVSKDCRSVKRVDLATGGKRCCALDC